MGIADQLDRLLQVHASDALSDSVLIPDLDEEINWHSFLGHHDFFRFRGDKFFLEGRGTFVPLRGRTPPLGISFLATAWHQLERANPQGLRGKALLARYRWRSDPAHKQNLRADLAGGGDESREYLAIWDSFRNGIPLWYAYILHDAAVLADRFSSSFRRYLERACKELAAGHPDIGAFPQLHWKETVGQNRGRDASLEDALASRITEDFAVGDEVARYLFCDWLLAFWHADHAVMFDSFKHDENARKFGEARGWFRSRREFLDICHQLRPALPPRVINECIWIHQNRQCACLAES